MIRERLRERIDELLVATMWVGASLLLVVDPPEGLSVVGRVLMFVALTALMMPLWRWERARRAKSEIEQSS